MNTAYGRGKRPYKVWDSGRQIRKGLVAGTFSELVDKGREKLDLGAARLRVVLEADGTQVEDPEYFQTLPENTVFLLLRQGEHWYPAGVEVLKQGTSSPRKPSATARVIVSGIGENTQRHDFLTAQASLGSTPSPIPSGKSPVPPMGTVTTIHRDGKKETLINDVGSSSSSFPHQRHLGSQESDNRTSFMATGGGLSSMLTRQGSSVDSAYSATVHIHTPECCSYGHPTPTPRSRSSPTGDQTECDFHCVSLHDGAGHIHTRSQYPQQTQASPRTTSSPVHEVQLEASSRKISQEDSYSPALKSFSQKSSPHVHFSPDHRQSSSGSRHQEHDGLEPPEPVDSSESETEDTTNDEEGQTCEKFLLLIDRPSSEQIVQKHLTIKDIGVILDRLSARIIDVERLDREMEEDGFNWTIKATIRGTQLRELGVLYLGNYYTICEHPAYGISSTSETQEDEEPEDEPV